MTWDDFPYIYILYIYITNYDNMATDPKYTHRRLLNHASSLNHESSLEMIRVDIELLPSDYLT